MLAETTRQAFITYARQQCAASAKTRKDWVHYVARVERYRSN